MLIGITHVYTNETSTIDTLKTEPMTEHRLVSDRNTGVCISVIICKIHLKVKFFYLRIEFLRHYFKKLVS